MDLHNLMSEETQWHNAGIIIYSHAQRELLFHNLRKTVPMALQTFQWNFCDRENSSDRENSIQAVYYWHVSYINVNWSCLALKKWWCALKYNPAFSQEYSFISFTFVLTVSFHLYIKVHVFLLNKKKEELILCKYFV